MRLSRRCFLCLARCPLPTVVNAATAGHPWNGIILEFLLFYLVGGAIILGRCSNFILLRSLPLGYTLEGARLLRESLLLFLFLCFQKGMYDRAHGNFLVQFSFVD